MSLTVETGDVYTDVDSYISLDDARTLAESYGHTLPTDDADCEVALRKAAIYCDSFEARFSGSRVDESQALSFPRQNAVFSYSAEIDEDEIPSCLKYAQVIAAATYGAGTDVRANDDGKAIASQAVSGAVSQSYFNNGETGSSIVITECVDALKTLFSSSYSNQFSFTVTRG